MQRKLSRRQMMARLGRAGAALAVTGAGLKGAAAASERGSIRFGACDWSIGKLAQVSGIEVAHEIGLDGLQVSLGTVADHMHLRRPEVQKAYLEASRQTGVAIASLAIGELNNVPYKSDPRTEAWVRDSINVSGPMGTHVVLLAFFNKDDLRGDEAGKREVVRRLKRVAPSAERAGVKLGIESWLSAEEHLDLIHRIGSPAVKVYYDLHNSLQMGYDIYKEIRRLGTRYICEFHAKEYGCLLGQGIIDFQKARDAIRDIGYSGWIQIEGSLPPHAGVVSSYQKNLAFLRGLFG